MREIKFRVWDTKKEKMITSYSDLDRDYMGGESMPLIPLTGGVVRPYWDKCKFDSQPHLELMQYTGLTDKNGTPVYECDIVEIYLYEYAGVDETQTITVGDNRDNTNFYTDVGYLQNINQKHMEVIGNKFEDKNLLE